MAEFDFHKVSENADTEVYEAMTRLTTKKHPDTGIAPVKYSPQTFKNLDATTVKDAIAQFDGYDIDAISLTHNSLSIRVRRNALNPFVDQEENVQRLKNVKGGAKK